MEIINTNSGPDYIHNFIENNISQLNEIFDNEKKQNGDGILYCKCSDKENKLELIYMNKELFIDSFGQHIWSKLQVDKRIIYVEDLDISEKFIFYI
jgi:hypothetical protein